MKRNEKEDTILVAQLDERFEKQKQVLDLIARSLGSNGVFCDLGCGSGLAIRYLKERVDLSYVGVDLSDVMLSEAATSTHGVVFLQQDIRYPALFNDSVDYVLLNKSVHEVYSLYGHHGVRETFESVHRVLKKHGRIYIYENVVPDYSPVELCFVAIESRNLFDQFVNDYSVTHIPYQDRNTSVVLSKRDALEFLTKFKEPNWDSEMKEAHFIYERKEWEKHLVDAGFADISFKPFDDRQILRTDGVKLNWDVEDYKHLISAVKQ